MLEKYVPDKYYKSVYDINYDKLKKMKIKCLIFDLDNTIVSCEEKLPNHKIKELFFDLKNMNFKVIIMSNSPKSRIEPFMNELGVDSCAFALKPKKNNYEKILNKYGFISSEVACIGDRIYTDVYGANNMGLLSILVNSISTHDLFASYVNRKLESIIYRTLSKKELFIRGKYYD